MLSYWIRPQDILISTNKRDVFQNSNTLQQMQVNTSKIVKKKGSKLKITIKCETFLSASV